MAKSNKGIIGIDYVINDEQARAKMQAYFSFIIKQIDTVTKAWEKADKAFSKEPAQRKPQKPPDHGPEINAAEQAAKRIEEVERRQSAIRESLSHKTREQLVKDRYELEAKHKALSQAMTEESNKEAQAEIKAQLSVLNERKRITSQMAAEKAPTLRQAVAGGVKDAGGFQGAISASPIGGMVAQFANPYTAVAAGLTAVIILGAQFEDQMADLSSITGLQGDALKRAGNNAKELGSKYGINATQGVESMKLVISALGPAVAQDEKSLKSMTDTTLQFAKAGGIDGKTATDALTISLSQFGYANASASKQAEIMARIANVQAAASKEGAAEIDDLSQSMKVAGATAAAANISIEETASWLEQLAPAGIKGAEAGTAFRNMVLKMSAGGKQATEQLKLMGLTYDDINPEKVGLVQGMERLQKGFDKLNDPVKEAKALQKLFGLENANAAKIMMQSAGSVDAFTKKITGTNAASEMAAAKMATLSEQFNRAVIFVKDFALTLYDALRPQLALIMDLLGFILPILGFVVDAIGWLIKANIDLYKMALTPLVEWLKKAWEIIKVFAGVLMEKLQPILEKVGGYISTIFNAAIASAWEWIKKAAEVVGGVVIKAFNLWWNTIKEVWGVLKFLVDIVIDVYTWIAKAIGKVIDFGAGLLGLGSPIKSVIGWLSDVVGWIKDTINSIGQFFGAVGKQANIKITSEERERRESSAAVIAARGITGTGSQSAAALLAQRLISGDTATGEPNKGGGLGGLPDSGDDEDTEKEKTKREKKQQREKKDAYTEAQTQLQIHHDRMLVIYEQLFTDEEITEEEFKRGQAAEDEKFYNSQAIVAAKFGAKHEDEKAKFELNASKARRAQKEIDFQQELRRQKEHEDELAKLKTFSDSESKSYEQRFAFAKSEEDAIQKIRIDAMQDGIDKQLALEQQRYEKERELAEGNIDYVKAVEDKHNQNSRDIKEAEFKKTNLTYKAGMALVGSTVDQGLEFIDAGWKRSFHNQKTALFEGLSIMSGIVKNSLAEMLKNIASKAVAFIAENLAVAASFIATAIASAFAWMWTVSPWLAVGAGGAIALAVFSQWSGIKKMLGFAEGGIVKGNHPVMGIIGEANKDEAVAPLDDLKAFIQDAVDNTPLGATHMPIGMEHPLGQGIKQKPISLEPLRGATTILLCGDTNLIKPLLNDAGKAIAPMMEPLLNDALASRMMRAGGMSPQLQQGFDELVAAMNQPRYMMMDMRNHILAQEAELNDIDGRRSE